MTVHTIWPGGHIFSLYNILKTSSWQLMFNIASSEHSGLQRQDIIG